jgi:AcrR family transcriptional regulator
MGYGTLAYAVDLDRLRSVFGSKDRALFEAIVEGLADDIRERDEWSREQIERGAPSLREALSQIIRGRITGPDWAGFQYGYATELLCKHLGHPLDSAGCMGRVADLGIPTGLDGSGPPLPIPRPKYVPIIGFLTADEVGVEYRRIRDQDLSHREELAEARDEFRSFLRQASEKNLGLVTFTY